MLGTLCFKNRYLHISLLKKYNKNNHYRYQEFDQYIKEQKYPGIQDYKQFCTDPAAREQIQINMTERQESSVHAMFGRERRGLSWTKKSIYPIHRSDDNQLDEIQSIGLENKTLLSFTKQAITQRNQHHQLYLLILFSIIVNPLLYFMFWYGDENEFYQSIMAVNPEKEEKYRLEGCEATVTVLEDRIKMYAKEILKQQ